jgi:hypothetical protein
MASLLMLVTWELWNKKNVKTFKNVSTMPAINFDKIKSEAKTWVIVGAKQLGLFISGE